MNQYDPDEDDSNLMRSIVTGCEPECCEKADLIRRALLAYARTTVGRERGLCETLAAQAEILAEVAQ